jgi:LacI family transcriptional regulator
MNIQEIARQAKVSTATGPRTINLVPSVDPQLAKRVWKVDRELGYYPNRQARALVSGRRRIFGLVVSEITNPFFPEIVQIFENLAVDNNYEILLTSTIHDSRRMELSVRRTIENRVDGVAIRTFGMEESLLATFEFPRGAARICGHETGPSPCGQHLDRLSKRNPAGSAASGSASP